MLLSSPPLLRFCGLEFSPPSLRASYTYIQLEICKFLDTQICYQWVHVCDCYQNWLRIWLSCNDLLLYSNWTGSVGSLLCDRILILHAFFYCGDLVLQQLFHRDEASSAFMFISLEGIQISHWFHRFWVINTWIMLPSTTPWGNLLKKLRLAQQLFHRLFLQDVWLLRGLFQLVIV